MASPLGVARCELVLRGLNYPLGGAKEAFAVAALRRRREAQFLTTLSIINAIMQVGGMIAGGSSSNDALKKNIDALRDLLLPELEEQTRARAAEVQRIIVEESSRGAMGVQRMGDGSKKKSPGKVKLRRR